MESTKFTQSEIKGIVKNFTRAYTFSSIGNSLISNVFILFMTVAKGFTTKQTSLILGVLPLISVVTFFMWGMILDKYKRLVFFNKFVTIINIITLLILLFVDNFTIFFILNLIRNIGMQPNGVANDEYLLNLSNKYDVSFGKVRVFGTIGYGIAGIITAISLIYLDSVQTTALSLIFLFPLLYFLFKLPEITGNEDKKNEVDKKKEKIYMNFIEILKNKDYVKFIMTFCLLTAVITSATSYANSSILIKLNAPESLIGIIPIVMIIFEMILLAKIESFKFYKKTNLMLITATVLSLFRWFVLGATTSYVVITIINLIHGVINGILLPLQNRLIWNIAPRSQHSTAFILTSLFCYTIFPAIINLIIGALSDTLGIKTFGVVYFVITLIPLAILINSPFKDTKLKANV